MQKQASLVRSFLGPIGYLHVDITGVDITTVECGQGQLTMPLSGWLVSTDWRLSRLGSLTGQIFNGIKEGQSQVIKTPNDGKTWNIPTKDTPLY